MRKGSEGAPQARSGAATQIGSGTERVGTGTAPASPARPHRTALIGFQNRGRLFIAGEAEHRFPFRSSPQARPVVPAPAAVRGRLSSSLGWRGWAEGAPPGPVGRGEASPALPRIHPPVQTQAATPYLPPASPGSAAGPLQLPRPPPLAVLRALLRTSSPRDRRPSQAPARAIRAPVPIAGHPGGEGRAGSCRSTPGCRGRASRRWAGSTTARDCGAGVQGPGSRGQLPSGRTEGTGRRGRLSPGLLCTAGTGNLPAGDRWGWGSCRPPSPAVGPPLLPGSVRLGLGLRAFSGVGLERGARAPLRIAAASGPRRAGPGRAAVGGAGAAARDRQEGTIPVPVAVPVLVPAPAAVAARVAVPVAVPVAAGRARRRPRRSAGPGAPRAPSAAPRGHGRTFTAQRAPPG